MVPILITVGYTIDLLWKLVTRLFSLQLLKKNNIMNHNILLFLSYFFGIWEKKNERGNKRSFNSFLTSVHQIIKVLFDTFTNIWILQFNVIIIVTVCCKAFIEYIRLLLDFVHQEVYKMHCEFWRNAVLRDAGFVKLSVSFCFRDVPGSFCLRVKPISLGCNLSRSSVPHVLKVNCSQSGIEFVWKVPSDCN